MTTQSIPEWTGRLLQGDLVAGRFLVSTILGEGGQGQVVLAVNQRTQMEFALKVMSAAAHADPKQLARIFTEASASKLVDSDVFVKIYDMIEHNGLPVLVSEYVPGLTLTKDIELRGPMTVSRAAKIARQVALGLNQAQRKGFIHRDIKPDNIMVTSEDRAKVLDFGIAKNLNDSTGLKTQEGLAFGTPAFMSPQQARGEQLDGRTDLYSLGGVLFCMVTGRMPFMGKTAMDFIIMHISEPPPLASAVNPSVPAAFAEIIDRCLKKDPKERFQTGQELADALARFEASQLVPDETRGTAATTRREVPPPGATRAAPDPGQVPQAVIDERTVRQEPQQQSAPAAPVAGPPKRSKAVAVIGVGLVVAVAVAAGLWLTLKHPPTPHEDPVVAAPTPSSPIEPKPAGVVPVAVEGARVFLEVSPADAEVTVDGQRRVGASPFVVEGKAGQAVEVKVSAPSYVMQTLQLKLATGDQRRAVVLVAGPASPAAAPAEAARGKIEVLVEPTAMVYLDGKKIGKTPIKNLSVALGVHRVRLVNDDRGFPASTPFEKKITVRAGRTEVIDLDWR